MQAPQRQNDVDQFKQTFQEVCEMLDKTWQAGCMTYVEKNVPEIYKQIQDALHDIDAAWGEDWGLFAQALFRWRVACSDAIKKFND